MDAADIERKVRSGERLSRADGIALYDCDDLAWLGGLAHQVRTRHSGDTARFAVHRSLELTADTGEAIGRATRWAAEGVTELRLTTGAAGWSGLPGAVRALRDALPAEVALTACTAADIAGFGAEHADGASGVLDALAEAGSDGLCAEGPVETAAEAELSWEERARVLRLAHGKGLAAPCTLRYGSVAGAAERADFVDRLLRLRELQDETGGCQVFLPLRRDVPQSATGAEILTTFAVSRLLLDNVPHVAVDWALHSVQTAQLALQHGADEMAGPVVDGEQAQGGGHSEGEGDALTREDLLDLITDTGFRPVQRDARHRELRSFPGPDPQRRETPQPMRV
ncbi:radical SAM protein [Streptomyces sp. NPDC006925]|uniref:radical SAM protein n=1 Tax=Streptomyces sp. NPDC006925 TaxID=3364768 RepID=UPI0036970A25